MTEREIITVAALTALMLALAAVWAFDRRRRGSASRGSSSVMSGVLGGVDQVFHPNAAKAQEIREIQREIPADPSADGDPLEPGGRIVIDARAERP